MDQDRLAERYRRYIDCLNERRWDDLPEFLEETVTYNGEPWTAAEYRDGRIDDFDRIPDLRAREVLAVAPLLALMVFLGFYPKPLTDVITPAVDATMQDAGFTDPAPTQGDGEPAAAPTR